MLCNGFSLSLVIAFLAGLVPQPLAIPPENVVVRKLLLQQPIAQLVGRPWPGIEKLSEFYQHYRLSRLDLKLAEEIQEDEKHFKRYS